MKHLFFIALGGGLGALSRYGGFSLFLKPYEQAAASGYAIREPKRLFSDRVFILFVRIYPRFPEHEILFADRISWCIHDIFHLFPGNFSPAAGRRDQGRIANILLHNIVSLMMVIAGLLMARLLIKLIRQV